MPKRRCDGPAMTGGAPLMLLALALATAAAAAAPAHYYEMPSEMVVPQKRAALVLDRILVALQKALREEPRVDLVDNGPRIAALRVPYETNDMSALQRRGQGGTPSRGRVLRCYFNAVTCF